MARTATLYRMVLPDHICPYGVLAKTLLVDHGFLVEEHILRSRDEVEDFKAEQGLETTPLIVIEGKEIGGADQLKRYLAENSDPLPLPDTLS